MPSTQEINKDYNVEVILSNPLNKNDKLVYYIDLYNHDLTSRWCQALVRNLEEKYHLEKNYCFLGWAKSPRNAEYLCEKINEAISQINKFNQEKIWQAHGLRPYTIEDCFTTTSVISDGEIGYEKPGLKLIHDPMNRLHRYFEDLQGEAWNISPYYQLADYETKWAIRQLNDLCHELESWALSNRKIHYQPEWQRPSQITTFLNAPRYNLQDQDYTLFLKNRYDREFGGVYLHWAQVGKTLFEVFRDEHGQDIDEATCSAINHLKFYSGEFDVEWGQTVAGQKWEWHNNEQEEFQKWLKRNNFDWNDPKLSLGYIKLGQINFEKSFGTKDFLKILDTMSNYLNIHEIKVKTDKTIMSQQFDYVWSDTNYKQMQIDFLKPGYDWSKRQYGK